MIIYLDLIRHDEMFSDIYKIQEVANELCLEVKEKIVGQKVPLMEMYFAEGPESEGTKSTVITGVDIVRNYYLQKTNFTNEACEKYIIAYRKSV